MDIHEYEAIRQAVFITSSVWASEEKASNASLGANYLHRQMRKLPPRACFLSLSSSSSELQSFHFLFCFAKQTYTPT